MEEKQRVCTANSVGPIAHFGETETLWRETESLQSHLGETEIPIGETELIRGFGYGYVKWTRWRQMNQIGGPSLTLGLGHMWKWKSGWGILEHITKHFEQASH